MKQPKRTIKGPVIEENSKNEIDRKIDMILGFDNLETGRKSYKDDDELTRLLEVLNINIEGD